MNDSTSWPQATRCYEWHKVVDDINNSGCWAQSYKCDEFLKTVVNMNDFKSLA